MTRLPVEVLHLILAFHVAAYIDEMVGPHAKITEEEEEGDEETVKQVVARPMVPLLLASYQFRQITVEILSRYLGIPLDESGDRLQSSPWACLATVRSFILTGSKSGMIVAELESTARSSPALAVYIFARIAQRNLGRVPRMYNVSALTVGDSQFAYAQGLWEEALHFSQDACEKAQLAPAPLQATLEAYAQATRTQAMLAQRYGTLLTMLVRGVQVLRAFQAYDATRAAGEPARLPTYLPRFLQMLRHADTGTHVERKHGGRADVRMPETQDIANLCKLMQRVLDTDVPDSEVYEECKALARTLKDEYEEQLARIRGTAQATSATVPPSS
ncbi:hypothetical protein PsYK624_118420 [Phanerochaete sordida]|uniref:Uncharacterized protein n=1 Tax=Phanerochaete sordida TaxID=48140 RepID=A0A9P3GIZ9_9APHY|nr:hypothetical protein PsYK624_118420 [Phanerochaete sordida]